MKKDFNEFKTFIKVSDKLEVAKGEQNVGSMS